MLAQLEDHEQPGLVPAGPFLILHPCPELLVLPTLPSALLTLSLGLTPAGSSGRSGSSPGLTAHRECQEQPLVHWAQQLVTLIKKGKTQPLSGCDRQFCLQPGLLEARQGGQQAQAPAWSLGSQSRTEIHQKTSM